MVAKGNEQVGIYVTPQSLSGINDLRLGFMESANPRKFAAMLQLATLNAARTLVKPIKAEAPSRTGRLKNSVASRKGRFNKPSAIVGVRAGKSRGDMKGAWYRWFVVSGTNGTRITKNGSKVAVKPIRANNFVGRATNAPHNQARAVEALNSTVKAFMEGAIKHRKGRGR